MSAPRPSRLKLILALCAWLMQALLPTAHASLMSQQALGTATWCGAGSPALEAQLAHLPPDVQKILKQGAAQSDDHEQQCALACAGGGSTPSEPATVALRAAGLEVEVHVPAARPRSSPQVVPPARGPPALS